MNMHASSFTQSPTSISQTPYSFAADFENDTSWTALKLSYIEFTSPQDLALETGRFIKLLSNYQYGLAKEEILKKFYDKYDTSSPTRQSSLRACLEKLIQRARVCFSKHQITIKYSKDTKKYFLVQTETLN